MPETSLDRDLWNENLQESIQAASQQGKTLLCFVSDGSDQSNKWKEVIERQTYRKQLTASTVPLHLYKSSQGFGFLTVVCPVQHVPALVLIKGGQIEEKLENSIVSLEDLKKKLNERYTSTDTENTIEVSKPTDSKDAEQCLEFAPSTGRMRLPNNAYDALRERTEKLQEQKISPRNILLLQLRLMDNVSALKASVKEIRSRRAGAVPSLSDEMINRLLNTPASALQPRQNITTTSSSEDTANASSDTPSAQVSPETTNADIAPTQLSDTLSPPAQPPSQPRTPSPSGPDRSSQQAQRANYIRQQRERQAAQRTERERIKAQIKADRDERRRLDAIRKQGELATLRQENSTTPAPTSTDIRIQIRTFNGSTLRTTFTKSATIAEDVRPWIDGESENPNQIPYNLKLMLSPSQNRDIQVEEEEHVLPDLGIVGSATLIMVPVKGFVDSYSNTQPGLVGSVVGGVTGAAGSLIGGVTGVVGSVAGGVLGMLGLGSSTTPAQQSASTTTTTANEEDASSAATSGATVKVRTLADQRAEDAKRRGNQLYNGNSLDFQGRKDDEDRKED